MNTPDLGAEWDLGSVLAERTQPTDTVSVYLNEAASYAKAQLIKAQANIKGDKAEDKAKLAEIEKTIAETDELLEKSKYTVHLTGVPTRMREDIHSKAQHKFPQSNSILEREAYETVTGRQDYENMLVWLAQITDVVNPAGQSKRTWDEDSMQKFMDALPAKAQNTISEAIQTLTIESESYTIKSKDIDFS